jgi:hypothetical protein
MIFTSTRVAIVIDDSSSGVDDTTENMKFVLFNENVRNEKTCISMN